MPLTVEQGAGLPDAESYASVAAADAYHLARRNDAWLDPTVPTERKEAALRRATDFLDGAYRTRWQGYQATPGQALAWPRAWVRAADLRLAYLPSDAIPQALIRACCECALRELEEPGSLSPDIEPGSRVTSESVGPLSVSYADDGAGSTVLPVLTGVNRLLAPLLRSATAGGLVLRA